MNGHILFKICNSESTILIKVPSFSDKPKTLKVSQQIFFSAGDNSQPPCHTAAYPSSKNKGTIVENFRSRNILNFNLLKSQHKRV